MEGQLKNGTIFTSESGNKYEVVSLLGAGGQEKSMSEMWQQSLCFEM